MHHSPQSFTSALSGRREGTTGGGAATASPCSRRRSRTSKVSSWVSRASRSILTDSLKSETNFQKMQTLQTSCEMAINVNVVLFL